jgi:hypothetical protein
MYDSDFSITTSPSMCMMIALVQTGPQLFFLFFRVGFVFLSCLLLMPLFCCQIWNLFDLVIRSSINSIHINLNPKCWEVDSTYENIFILVNSWVLGTGMDFCPFACKWVCMQYLPPWVGFSNGIQGLKKFKCPLISEIGFHYFKLKAWS